MRSVLDVDVGAVHDGVGANVDQVDWVVRVYQNGPQGRCRRCVGEFSSVSEFLHSSHLNCVHCLSLVDSQRLWVFIE